MEKIYKVTQETERTVKPTKAKFCLHCLHCKALVSEVLTTGWCLTFYTATSHQFPSLNFPCQRSSAMKLRRKESRAFQVPDCDPRLTRPHHTPMGTAWPGSSHLAGSSWDSAPANTTRGLSMRRQNLNMTVCTSQPGKLLLTSSSKVWGKQIGNLF